MLSLQSAKEQSHLSPAFWMAIRLQLSLTSTERTKTHASQLVVQTKVMKMEGAAAMSMRLTT
jgi:hypothetical protein